MVLGPSPEVVPGARFRCFAQLSAPERPENPGAPDRAARLRADRVLARLRAPTAACLSILETGSAWNPRRLLERLRENGAALLERYLNPRRAELAEAVLLGFREELDSDRKEAFLTTGTIHILCISGLHVGILAGVLFGILRRLPISRAWSAAAVAATTLLYALTVDASPSIVRATTLVLVACAAVWLGRRPLSWNSLAAAALVVLAINPSSLFHVGAQLSFLCVAGLIGFAKRRPRSGDIKKRQVHDTLKRLEWQNLSWPERTIRGVLRSACGITLAGVVLWLLTLPLIAARFHVLSTAAIFLNAVLWIPMTVGLMSGFGVMLFGAFCPPLGLVCGRLCDWSFSTLERSVDFAHEFPGSHFWLPGPADWWL